MPLASRGVRPSSALLLKQHLKWWLEGFVARVVQRKLDGQVSTRLREVSIPWARLWPRGSDRVAWVHPCLVVHRAPFCDPYLSGTGSYDEETVLGEMVCNCHLRTSSDHGIHHPGDHVDGDDHNRLGSRRALGVLRSSLLGSVSGPCRWSPAWW